MAPAWIDPDDAPDLSAPEWRAKVDAAPVIRPRGRPRSEASKVPTSLRLAPDVLDAFKATGVGWQTRMEAALWDSIERLERGGPADVEARRRALDAMIERRRRSAAR